MRILGIETSADDTGVALIEADGTFGADFNFKVLGNAVASQSVHASYGGIFPAIAKREHAKNLVPTLEKVLREAKALEAGAASNVAHVRELLVREPEIFEHLDAFLKKYDPPEVDAIAVTVGPGLEPCLWTGINLARVLADVWDIPVVGVNHMEGHLIMSMMEIRSPSSGAMMNFDYPALALLVSGGHTELILMKALGEYQYIGRTRDDAAGEAFDKIARMLELPYPGGPAIARLAAEAREKNLPSDIKLPRPMLNEDNFDFSFSGLKTAVLRLLESDWQGKTLPLEIKAEIAREVEDTITEVLVEKTVHAAEEYGVSAVIMSGGVSANSHIRSELTARLQAASCQMLVCPPEFSTDNGLMIALSGYFYALNKEFAEPSALTANGQLKLG